MATAISDQAQYTPPIAPPDPALSPQATPWNPLQRVGFRFLFAYFALFSTPRLLPYFPILGSTLSGVYFQAVRALAVWIGANVLHKPVVLAPSGSGDTLAGYLQFAIEITIAVVATIVWTAVARRREYRRLNEWLRIGVRFTLAFILFGYGFAKILPNQFPYPTLERLAEPLGEFSPMGLLWTFMGYSVAYNFFTGMGEALGAFLLCFRRTTTAGALLLIAVMSNVVILNYTYDVPVKLYSTIYLLMAVFLVAPDAERLLNVLLLNRPTEPRDLRLFTTARMHQTSMALRGLLVAFVLFSNLSANITRYKTSTNGPLPALYGIYDVQSMTKNGKDVPLVVTDPSLWRRVIFSRFDRMSIRTMSDSMARYTVQVNDVARTMTATARFDPTMRIAFTYTRPGPGQIILAGVVGVDTVTATLRRVDESKYLLNSRGFNWIQEQPFNR